MRYAIITTETSGLFDYSKPADSPGQPRLAAFGYQEFVDGELDTTYFCYIQPAGWSMQAGATGVNGLTTDWLEANGLDVEHALAEYVGLLERGCTLVGYAIDFDCKVMRGELRRAGMLDHYKATEVISMQRVARDVCKIPTISGGNRFPKLHEACAHFDIPWKARMTSQEKLDTLNALFVALKISAGPSYPIEDVK